MPKQTGAISKTQRVLSVYHLLAHCAEVSMRELTAFMIMESVNKGKGLLEEYRNTMIEYGVRSRRRTDRERPVAIR